MKIYSKYNGNNRLDYAWYDSSNVYFSLFNEDEKNNKGDLDVTFKNGATYRYKDVKTQDYILFKFGGLDGSQGKSLNSFIKKWYEFEKLDNKSIDELELLKESFEKDDLIKPDLTYFISGHRQITEEQFSKYYKAEIKKVIDENPDLRVAFIMGDYYGADIMAQNYLMDELNYDIDLVTVYHMMDSPRNVNSKIIHFVGGFGTDEERDAAMTENSNYDIAYVSDHLKLSGTAMNLLRRKLMK